MAIGRHDCRQHHAWNRAQPASLRGANRAYAAQQRTYSEQTQSASQPTCRTPPSSQRGVRTARAEQHTCDPAGWPPLAQACARPTPGQIEEADRCVQRLSVWLLCREDPLSTTSILAYPPSQPASAPTHLAGFVHRVRGNDAVVALASLPLAAAAATHPLQPPTLIDLSTEPVAMMQSLYLHQSAASTSY